jgi:Tfp pilus assembly protein PilN
MTLLNLLPHRAWALAQRRRAVWRELAAAVVLAACMGLVAGLLWPGGGVPVPQAQRTALPTAGDDPWPPAPSASRAAPAPRPSAWLHAVSQAMPPQVALTALEWEGVQLTLQGQAATAEAAHAFLHALRQQGSLLHAVQWVSLQAAEPRAVNDRRLQFVLKAQVAAGLSERGGP